MCVSCLPVLRDIFHTSVARCGVFVLKVPLNTSQLPDTVIESRSSIKHTEALVQTATDVCSSTVEGSLSISDVVWLCDVVLCEMPDDDDVAGGAGDLLSWRHISEIYYLWKLAGGDLEGSLRKAGLIRQYPPITQLPSSVVPFCLHFITVHLCLWQAVLLTLCVGWQAEHQVSKTSWFSNSQRFSFGTFWGTWSNPSLSLRFNGHFPGEPGLAGVNCLLKQRLMEVVVTTGLLEL